MSDEKEATQAMPDDRTPDPPRPTQPTHGTHRHQPLIDDEGFGGFMGHGGQTDITDETEDGKANPNSTAQED